MSDKKNSLYLRIDIISVVPQTFESVLNASILKRAREAGLVEIVVHNLHDYGLGRYKQVDDTPYGGGAGMILRPEPIFECVERLKSEREYDEVIFLTPDGELLDVGDTVGAMEAAGFEVRDVQSLREHYARTLRHWVANLEAEWDRAVELVGEARARVWRLYMAASAIGFDDGGVSIHQVLGVVPTPRGGSGMPDTRDGWSTSQDPHGRWSAPAHPKVDTGTYTFATH